MPAAGLRCCLFPLLAEPGPVADALPTALIAGGVVVAFIAILCLLPRRSARPADAASLIEPKPIASPAAIARDAEELAHRLAAEVDAKAARLESLLKEANATINRLERLVSATNEKSQPPPRARGSALPAPTMPLDPVTIRVYELADTGKTPIEIAQSLGQHTGQVELILALRR